LADSADDETLKVLAECEHVRMHAGVKELDLKGPSLHLALFTDELIETRLSNLAAAIRTTINSTLPAGCGAVQRNPKANGLTV